MKLQVDYYKTVLMQTKRGSGKGKPSNAKIFFLLSIFKNIESGCLAENKIYFNSEMLDEYKRVWSDFTNDDITPFFKPFFHLSSSPYYHIKWKTKDVPSHSHSLSAKQLRETVEYAYLDDALWELLQDEAVRGELRESLVNHFLR